MVCHLLGTFLPFCTYLSLSHLLAIDTRPDLLANTQVKITSGARIGIIVAGVVLALIAVISLFGYVLRNPSALFRDRALIHGAIPLYRFIGSVIRNRRMVRAYSTLVWICFFFTLALSGFTTYLVFSKSSLIKCYDKDLNEIACSTVLNTGRKVGFIISTVIGLLFQLCKPVSILSSVRSPSNPFLPLLDICVIIRRYVEQLEDEQAYKNDFGLNKKSTSYYPFQSVDSGHGLLNSKH